MKQVWIPRIGPPEVLTLRETDEPEPGRGEVLVNVRAAGVNFADILARLGLYPDAPKLPAVVGYEVAGEVARCGEGVDEVRPGERVLAITRFGGYAERVVVPASQVFAMPAQLDFAQAASLPVNYLTAWIMLYHLANVQRGQSVFVHAVAGGVGQAATQLCLARGARVLGTASASKHDRLKERGVDVCIDSRTKAFDREVERITNGHGVDVVLDAVGGRSFKRSYRCLAPLGKLYVFGVSSFAPSLSRRIRSALWGLLRTPRFHPVPLMNDNRGVHGVNLGHLWDQRTVLERGTRELLALVESGAIRPVVDRTFPFAEAAAAHRYIQERRNFGKVLLVP
ncbi:MAG: zinc-binding dehydrogenase [Planctomycetes bacterium]|nr:zinc-binding dehydrogenase [Planctomycetota bacterium]